MFKLTTRLCENCKALIDTQDCCVCYETEKEDIMLTEEKVIPNLESNWIEADYPIDKEALLDEIKISAICSLRRLESLQRDAERYGIDKKSFYAWIAANK